MINKVMVLLGIASVLYISSGCSKKYSDDSYLEKSYVPIAIIPTDNGTIYGLDANTGAKKWEHKPGQGVLVTPAVVNDTLAIFGDQVNSLVAITTKTGKQIWKTNLTGPMVSNPSVYNKQVYITVENTFGNDSIYRIDQSNGAILWRVGANTRFKSAPAFSGTKLYIGGTDGFVYCWDINSANFANADWKYNTGGQVLSNVAANGTAIYAANILGKLTKINDAGAKVWEYNCADKVVSAPMVYGGMVVIGSEDFYVHCVDEISGVSTFRWKYKTNSRVKSSATVDRLSQNIIIGSNDFNIYAINHVTGALSWKYPAGSIVNTAPVFYDDKIYFTSVDNYIYCLSNAGRLKWKFNLNSPTTGSPMVCTFGQGNYYPSNCAQFEP
jgi:eukaryotic-like serine/threonine-protein kinase